MNTIVIIFLAVIAYFLWKIYRQREEEKEKIANEKFEAEWEASKKEEFKDYPHLIGNIDYSWLNLFGKLYVEKGFPHLKVAFLLMLQESTKIDFSKGAIKWDTLWNCTEELLEHLEKYHEGSITEYEIAVTAYWQIAVTKMGELIEAKPNTGSLSSGAHTSPIEEEELKKTPFTDIEKIPSWFPKKSNHPEKELTFTDENGTFPRESKGSVLIRQKLKALGL